MHKNEHKKLRIANMQGIGWLR